MSNNNSDTFDLEISEKKLSLLRSIFKRRKDLFEHLARGEISTEEIKAILTFRAYFEISLFVASALLLAIFLPMTRDPLALIRMFVITFIITLSAAYMADRVRRPLVAKLGYIAASSSNRLYNFLITLGEALADGKITPEEGAKLIQALLGGGKK